MKIVARHEVREMADLEELFGPEAWGPIQDQLKRGENPDLSEIATALRGSQEIPHDVRCYIAGLLDGTIKRKRGPKVDKSASKRLRDFALRSQVYYWIEVCKRAERCDITTPGGPYRTARQKVSEKTGISEDTLDKIYYPRRKPKGSAP